eukprot:TRINITY_DN441_c0_g5_i2.p2 TRINITY_DN441_c0_g5~~TRINITY_DN441_c0_g5_i2.p2  ORF type:complete len:309 (-),score=67.85 TRINITY_DN441_c0_g5_i2:928-1854(-)
MEGNYHNNGGREGGYDNYHQGRGRSGSGADRSREEMPPPRSGGFGGNGGRGGGGAGGGGFRGTPENAKTKMCLRWMKGDCRFGDRCNFAHSESELRKSQAPTRHQEDDYSPSREGGRNGYHPREGSYSEGVRGNYRDYREGGPRREYDEYSPNRGERQTSYQPPGSGGRGTASREELPTRSAYEDRRDFPPSRDEEGYEYVPPSRSGGERGGGGASYRSKEEENHQYQNQQQQQQQQHHPRADYSEKPEGMTDEVWAGSGYAVPGPSGWWRYMTDKGEHYYHKLYQFCLNLFRLRNVRRSRRICQIEF